MAQGLIDFEADSKRETTMTEEIRKQKTQSRRAFLKGAGTVSVAAAATTLVNTDKVEASEVTPKKAAGYSETDAVRAYYEAARF